MNLQKSRMLHTSLIILHPRLPSSTSALSTTSTMKLSTPISLLLPTLISATPLTTTNPTIAALQLRDKTCQLRNPGLQGCDSSPYSGRRVTDVKPTDRFDISCTAKGTDVEGRATWDYVPGWKCWIWSGWTDDHCEGEVSVARRVRRC